MHPRNFARVALEVLHSQVLVRKNATVVRPMHPRIFCGIPRAYKRYFATTNRNILKAYRVLNVTSESSPEEIKTAYLKKVKETHPDQNPGSFTAAEDFIKVTDILKEASHQIRARKISLYPIFVLCKDKQIICLSIALVENNPPP